MVTALTWLDATIMYKVFSTDQHVALNPRAPAPVYQLSATRRYTPRHSSPDHPIDFGLFYATLFEQELLSTPLLLVGMHDRLRRRRIQSCHADIASTSANNRRRVLEQAGVQRAGLCQKAQPLSFNAATCSKALPSICRVGVQRLLSLYKTC